MDNTKLTHYRKILDQATIATSKEIDLLKESAKPVVPENSLGRLARMEAISQQKVQERALKNSQNKLELIQRAIQRIEVNDFGDCLKCGEEINEKRLEAAPHGPLCLSCAN